ncbi:MAG: hypothetical protein V2B18_17575 [Pseudomonadota bacterium]
MEYPIPYGRLAILHYGSHFTLVNETGVVMIIFRVVHLLIVAEKNKYITGASLIVRNLSVIRIVSYGKLAGLFARHIPCHYHWHPGASSFVEPLTEKADAINVPTLIRFVIIVFLTVNSEAVLIIKILDLSSCPHLSLLLIQNPQFAQSKQSLIGPIQWNATSGISCHH